MPKVFFEREEFLRTTTRGHRGSVSYGLVAFALSLFAFLPAQAVARLGTWQGIYLFEHRRAGHRRKISVTILGE